MAPQSTANAEDQLKYVLACIKHNETPIKPNFQKVADECGIVTREAASKRWSRLMKAQGVEINDLRAGPKRKAGDLDDGTPSIPAPSGTKRKAAKHDEGSSEGLSSPGEEVHKEKTKKENGNRKTAKTKKTDQRIKQEIKQEPTGDSLIDSHADTINEADAWLRGEIV